MIELARHAVRIPPTAAVILRAGVVAWRDGGTVTVIGAGGTRTLQVDAPVESHELSVDGCYLLTRSDDGRRAQAWEVVTGERVLEAVGDEHRQSLQANVASIDGAAHAFVISRRQRGVLRVLAIPGGEERSWQVGAGMLGFLVDGVVALEPGWLGIRGHGDGEQRDTVVAVPAAAVLSDPFVMQTALTEAPSVLARGYRLAIGPAGDGRVITFHDPESDPDDPPDDPDDAFCGFIVWDLATRQPVDRVAYTGAVADGATIGADETRIFVEGAGYVDTIARDGGAVRRLEALALDPHALQLARRAGDHVVIEAL